MIDINNTGSMVICSLSVASISWTISKSRVFEPFRKFLSQRWEWWYNLFSCPYCLSHYMSAVFVLLVKYRPIITNWVILDYVIAGFATVTLSSAFAGYFIRFAMAYDMKELEKIESLHNALSKAKELIKGLRN